MPRMSITCLIPVIWISVPSAAFAEAVTAWSYSASADGSRTLVANTSDELHIAVGDRSYDNWRYPGGNPPGQSLIGERLNLGNVEVGDDLYLNDWQPSKISDVGWSLCNNSSTGTMTFFGAAIRWYDGSLNLLATDTATYSGQSFAPGSRALVRSSGGFYQRFNFFTQPIMYMSIEFFDTVGVNPDDIGVLYGGPITFGNSSQYIRNMTTSQLIDLGADPQANLGFFIDTVVPSPSSASLLAASSFLAFRRRR